MTTQLTRDELLKLIGDHFESLPEVVGAINRWTDRGDGVAVYRNHDLGRIGCGSVQLVSFGSKAAQLETDTPPQRLPDIGGNINWRYQLEATYRPPLQSNPEPL